MSEELQKFIEGDLESFLPKNECGIYEGDSDGATVREPLSSQDSGEESSAPMESVALPVTAMRILLNVIRRSSASTMMGLQDELTEASEMILTEANSLLTQKKIAYRSTLPLTSGCDLFRRYITRCSLDFPDVSERATRDERCVPSCAASRISVSILPRSQTQCNARHSFPRARKRSSKGARRSLECP